MSARLSGWIQAFRSSLLIVVGATAVCVGGAAQAQGGAGEAPPEGEVTAPTLTRFVEAAYPARAEAEGVEAVVVLEIDIDAEGRVEEARVTTPAEPAGYGFDEAALGAARQFEFEPARLDGEPIPVRLAYSYGFQLKPRPEPEPAPEEAEPAPRVVNMTGRVLERGTRDPMVGVTVVVYQEGGDEPVGFEGETDGEGRFAFTNLAPGRWSVRVEPSGYLVFETEEVIEAGQVTEVVYFVERGRDNPYDVMVESERPLKEVTRRTLGTAEIERVPGTFGDPVTVITNLPGVARSSFASGQVVVRGSETTDSEAYIEGAPILSVYHFGGLRSVIPAGMLEQVDFYPGNFGVRYGQKMGGVLDVQLKELRPEAVHGYVDVNLFDAGFYVEAPVGDDGAVAVAARRSYIDVVLDSLVGDDAPVNIVSAPRYVDGQVLASWRPTDAHRLRLFAFATDDRFEIVARSAKDLDTRVDGSGLSLRNAFSMISLFDEYTPTTRLTNKVQLGTSLFKGDNEFFGMHSRSTLSEVFLREELSYRFSEEVTLNVGLDGRAGLGKVDMVIGDLAKEGDPGGDELPADNLQRVELDQWFTSGGVFMDVDLRPVSGLQVTPGVRLDVQRWSEELTLDPRLNARYAFNDVVAVKGGVGLYHQAPEIEEIIEGWGNPELESQRALHTSAGVEVKPLDHLLIDVTGFYKSLDNLVTRTDRVTERDGEVTPLLFDNSGEGRVYGLELMVRHSFAYNFSGWVAYTLSRSERFDPAANRYRLFDYDQTHVLTMVGTYRLPWNMELGARWRLVSGNPQTPITGAALDSDRDQYVPLYGAVNTSRAPMFHQLDLRLDKRWVFNTWMLTTYLDVQNVTNRANVESTTYNYDYSESGAVQGLPLIPALGIKAEF